MEAESSFHITRVVTRDSHLHPGEPLRFFHDGIWRDVEEVQDRWYEGSSDPERPFILYVKVKVGETICILRYLSYFDRWQMREMDL